MLTVSLHKIQLHAPIGLHAQEHVLGNILEIDVDLFLPAAKPWPYADYGLIRAAAVTVFEKSGELLETFVAELHEELKRVFPFSEKVRVAVRKMNPPLPGVTGYAQICYEA